nr:MAG: hypothetical protein DIU66_03390 [Bacillota bacterium]
MFSLIKKDLLVQRNYFLYGLFAAVVIAVSFQGLKEVMFQAMVFLLTYFFVQHACFSDDRACADLLLNSLPISRNAVVLARYVSLFAFFAIALLYYALLAGVVKILPLPLELGPVSFEGIAETLMLVVLVNSIFLPIFYKFGYGRSRIVNMILLLGTFGALGSAGEKFMNLFFALALYAFSYFVSLRIYLNKEF